MTDIKALSIKWFILSLLFISGCTGTTKYEGVSPGNTTYYIDPVNGADEHSGLRKNKAWKTFRHINQMQLAPGDRIEIMPGTFYHTLKLQGEGTAENPVKVDFAEGRYDFFTDSMYRGKYNISNTNLNIHYT